MQRASVSIVRCSFVVFAAWSALTFSNNSFAGGNSSPKINGDPPGEAVVNERYRFRPRARDRDGDTLRFRVVNLPPWAHFDRSTGKIAGRPSRKNVGIYDKISIKVTDGRHTSRLGPFAIEVVDNTNSAPDISGTPPGEATPGARYRFVPKASDADGDSLRFSVANRPSWASFDRTTGKLVGAPVAADVGIYKDIRISVTDGEDRSNLPPFSINVAQSARGNVTLSWEAPTRNADGSPLRDLTGYRIHYGTESRQYDLIHDIANPGVQTVVIENLTPTRWYFAVTAVDSSGQESKVSNEAATMID